MTKEQFEDIKQRLKVWREERSLTQEEQREGLIGNLFEELAEFERAKDDLEKIDAICDIAIFVFNSYNVTYEIFSRGRFFDETFSLNILREIINLQGDNLDIKYAPSDILFYCYKACEIQFNFDFYKCMLETIKEIESRTGRYDTKLNKFVKDVGAYTEREAYRIALEYNKDAILEYRPNELVTAPKDTWGFSNINIKKWYKADYESCRK